MANQTVVSSLIGANLSGSDSTALFALGTQVDTNDGGLYQYVNATATLNTGQWCVINSASSAYMGMTGRLTASADAGGGFGWAQNIINQGEYGWVAVRGRNLYIATTGTCTAGSELGFAFTTAGRIWSAPAAGVGNTILGLFITTSASTATAAVAVGTLTWPRSVLMQG